MEMVFLHGPLQGGHLSQIHDHPAPLQVGVSDSAFGKNAASCLFCLVSVTWGLPRKTETKEQVSVVLFCKYSFLQASLEIKSC